MATENKKILHIATAALSSLSDTQIGVMTGNDSDLGYPMWGGKDEASAVTYWLAKDQPGQLTTLVLTAATTITTAGILQHDAVGAITGKAGIDLLSDVNITSVADNEILRYDTSSGKWLNEAGALGNLDDTYDVDAGPAVIAVDAGDVTWDLNGAYSFIIDTVGASAGDGFHVLSSTDYFKVNYLSAATLALLADLETLTVTTAAALSMTSATTAAMIAGAASDLTFNARGGTAITLNEAGEIALAGGFSATSIIGALNELIGGAGGTLDDAYNADAGAAVITVDAGNITWDYDDDYDFIIDLVGVAQASGKGFKIEDGADYFRVIKATSSLRLNAELELFTINGAGNSTLSSEAQLNVEAGASGELVLGSRGATINLMEAGETALSGFTATSIVGGLNELKTSAVGIIDSGNGSDLTRGYNSELVTVGVGAGATGVDTSGALAPANSLILGISARVTNAPGGGATTFSVGITGGDADALLLDISTASTTTATSPADNDGTQLPLLSGLYGSASELTITTDANVTGSIMQVRIVVYYEAFTPPTS